MNDELGLFADDAGETRGRKARREERERFRRRRRSRLVTALAGLFVLALVGVGVLYGASQIVSLTTFDDYKGEGNGEVVIEVESGDTTSAIGTTLAEKDVVASAKAFVSAAEDNRDISGIQPGYYLMKSKMSGAAAVRHILSPDAAVGRVEIRAGSRLADQIAPNGGTTPGILTKLAQASCAGPAGEDCVTPEQMQDAARTADLAALGVPEWALDPASGAQQNRRLEGLIMPDLYDIKPGATAEQLLGDVVRSSTAKLAAAGLPQAAESTEYSPYQVLTMASLVQSEAIEKDFPKVSRVIYNRLTPPQMPLGLDSTINYPLAKPSLLTDPADRDRAGPYNTYQMSGLPPTPISSASEAAINAVVQPANGSWKYFVKCYKDGTSCFADTVAQHEAFKQEAQNRGAY